MIRSMTAFAASERSTDWGTLSAELRAVNHRYLELSVRLPEELRSLEPMLRDRISQRIARGKLDMSLKFRPLAVSTVLPINPQAIERLAALHNELSARFSGMRIDFTELLRFPGVLAEAGVDQTALHMQAAQLVDTLIDDFIAAREREGAKLAAMIRERLDAIAALLIQVRSWLPEIRSALRTRLETRLAELKQPLDPGRLEQELVLSLQKIDIDEELDRLDTHLAEAKRVLSLKEAIGRRFDFLLQEFNRESNTLGSKSIDAKTSQASVELKVLIEQIREQVQNLE